jgi:hypothetical protein
MPRNDAGTKLYEAARAAAEASLLDIALAKILGVKGEIEFQERRYKTRRFRGKELLIDRRFADRRMEDADNVRH